MLQRLRVVLLCAVGCGVTLSSPAMAQDLFFNTEIVSIDLTGSAMLPLGPAGESLDTTIHMTKVQDHNSSRSNKSSSIIAPPDPDDVNPNDLDGKVFPLYSTIDTKFAMDISAVGIDPPLVATLEGDGVGDSVVMDLDGQPSSFEFAALEPDFSMLFGGGSRSFTYRGHVTVLKVAAGGGGGDVEIPLSILELVVNPILDSPKLLPDGRHQYTSEVTLSMTGNYLGQDIVIEGLTGLMVERGALLNNVVPEPSTFLLALGGVALLAAGRHRRV
ncbi:PEP-CTERM sorting domain-containing protein [Aeoliella sp. SH292]|uniref:PEP-CTERM sorting domain-containing protein n=1 Tax=Aeoliella sp. SH292 TaxID=3454464 RepID=UPI003F94D205